MDFVFFPLNNLEGGLFDCTKTKSVYKQFFWHKTQGLLSLFFLTGTKSKKSLKVQMICCLFNIMVIYFYETWLLLFTLNYRYILGSISHSSASPRIPVRLFFFSLFLYFQINFNTSSIKNSTSHRRCVGPRQRSVEFSCLRQSCDPNSHPGEVPHVYQNYEAQFPSCNISLKLSPLSPCWISIWIYKFLYFYIFI